MTFTHSTSRDNTGILTSLLVSALLVLSACSDSDDTASSANDTDSPAESGNTTADTSARYRLTFTATWSPETHVQNFPGNPHFSGLIGAVHNEQVVFWEPGQIATDGIQQVAETGGKTGISSEFQTAIDSGSAASIINEGGIGTSPGSIGIEFSVTRDYPQITVVSMLAPSPDWFVGLHNYALLNNDGFIDSDTIELILYDSGSDDGVSYQSPNAPADPLSPIAPVNSEAQDSPFVNGEPIVGTFTLERITTN